MQWLQQHLQSRIGHSSFSSNHFKKWLRWKTCWQFKHVINRPRMGKWHTLHCVIEIVSSFSRGVEYWLFSALVRIPFHLSKSPFPLFRLFLTVSRVSSVATGVSTIITHHSRSYWSDFEESSFWIVQQISGIPFSCWRDSFDPVHFPSISQRDPNPPNSDLIKNDRNRFDRLSKKPCKRE